MPNISSFFRQFENFDSPSDSGAEETRHWAAEAELLAGIGSWIYDPNTQKESWTPGLVNLVNAPFNDTSPVLFEYIPALEKEIASFLQSRAPFCRRKFLLRTFDDTLVLLFQAEKRFDADGNVTHLLGTVQNITDIVWTFGIPGMGDQLLQAVVSCEDVVVLAVNHELTVTYLEGEGWNKLHLNPDEMIGQGLGEILKNHPHLLEAFSETLRGNVQNLYCTVLGRHYAVKIRPLLGAEGTVAGAIGFALDISDRNTILENLEETVRQRTKELEVSETTLQSLLAASNAAIIIVDGNLRIGYANAACHQMVDRPEKTLIGRSIDEFLTPKLMKVLSKTWNQFRGDVRSITHFRRQLSIRKTTDDSLWVDVNAALVCDDMSRPSRLVIVMFDVTDQRRHLEELREAKAASESANIAKSQFLAHMSHEIRTPLNGVIGLSDLLMGTNLSPKQSEYVGLINVSGKSLLFLINDILDFSKIEAGKMEIEEEDFDLLTTVESVLGILATRASDKGLELCGSFSSDIPRFVRGDSGRLRQVLINLVGNALKFTSQGGVKVQVFTERTQLSPDPCDSEAKNDLVLLRFSVIDTGIGISPEGLSRLFHSFTQVDNSASKQHEGSGLGLAISKHLVGLMRGELHVESVEGEGSIFWFTLPFPCRVEIRNCPARYEEGMEADDKPLCPRTQDTQCPLGRRRVMHGSVPLSDRSAIVVDDNEVQRDALAEQLTSWGMEVSKAASRAEALERLSVAARAGRPFQLAIIDSSIADGEGMDLVDAMKNDPEFEETAIILLTPLTVDTDIAVIHSAGVAMHVSKPVFSSSLFDATITALFSKDQAKSPRREIADFESSQTLVSEGYDEKRSLVRILVAEDNRINQIVVRDTLENVGFQCHVVENGRMAVEAVRNESFDAVLMDCQMPEMDGFAATEMIRENETGDLHAGRISHRIPVIALTANATKHDEAKCLRCGMDAYCSKPINPKVLVRTIDQWVGPVLRNRLENRTEEPVSPFSVKRFLILCGKNKMIATMVLSDFLNQVPRDLEMIETAVQEENWQDAAATLQHLRGKSGLLGATTLENSAARLEERCLTTEGDDPSKLLDVLFDQANRCIQFAAKAKKKILDDSLAVEQV